MKPAWLSRLQQRYNRTDPLADNSDDNNFRPNKKAKLNKLDIKQLQTFLETGECRTRAIKRMWTCEVYLPTFDPPAGGKGGEGGGARGEAERRKKRHRVDAGQQGVT